MSLLANLKKADSADSLPVSEDRLGGGSYIFPTGLYPVQIKDVYLTESSKGALGAVINYLREGSDYPQTETIYFSNVNKETFYVDKKSGKQVPLPGYTQLNDLLICAAGITIDDAATEIAVLPIRDRETKKDVPTEVECFVDLRDVVAMFGFVKTVENKTEQGDDNNYHPIAEKRETMVLNKIFAESGQTASEIVAAKDPAFVEEWQKKYTEDFVNDLYKEPTKTVGRGARPVANAAATAPAPRRFGAKK